MPRIICNQKDCQFNGLYQTGSALDGCCLTTSVVWDCDKCLTYQQRKPHMRYGYQKLDCVAKDGCKATTEEAHACETENNQFGDAPGDAEKD